jgi:hypothetical protein
MTGWRDLLERLCGRIEAALRAGETIQILQIKEKFAGLRCYWRGTFRPRPRRRLTRLSRSARRARPALARNAAMSANCIGMPGDIRPLRNSREGRASDGRAESGKRLRRPPRGTEWLSCRAPPLRPRSRPLHRCRSRLSGNRGGVRWRPTGDATSWCGIRVCFEP